MRATFQHLARLLLVAIFVLSPLASFHSASAVAPRQDADSDWLVMIYSAADDNVLEEDMMIDLQEAELIGSSDAVKIVVQTDRHQGAFSGMDDWTSTKRLLIEQDGDMDQFASTELDDLGEVNMSDGDTLRDFVVWAVNEFPAQRYALILSDHGAGWPGGWGDPNPGGAGDDDIALAEFFGDSLWLMEMGQALDEARAETGIESFDLIGFDACLMAQLEVFSAIAPHALFSVASEETEPGLGWSYAAFINRLSENPSMDGGELATAIVETYIDDDLRLEDPNYAGGLSPEEAAAEIFPETTLSAIDLAQISALNGAVDDFASAISTIDQAHVAAARTYAQSYETVFGDEFPAPYIDLGHFAQLVVQESNDPAVQSAYDELESALRAAVIAERHGEDRPGSTGISIYFPVQDLYEVADNLGYNHVAGTFADESQWDEFLAFHHGGASAASLTRPSSPLQDALQELMPDLDGEYIRILEDEINRQIEEGIAPEEIAASLVDEWELEEEVVNELYDQGLLGDGSGESTSAPVNTDQRKPLEIGPVSLSAEVAYPDSPVSVEATVEGDRVGYIYSFIGRYLPDDDILIVEDQDFIFADDDLEVGGVVYPDWADGDIDVSFDFEPVVYAISDGETSLRALFMPETYGDEPTYIVDGIWHFADGSEDRYATVSFSEGEAWQIFGFAGGEVDGTGAPWEITPVEGDQFTVYEHGYYLSDDAEEDEYVGELGTLTWGSDPFYIEATPAPSGFYLVGIQAEDYDGNLVESYEGLFVVGEDEVTEEGYVPLVDEEMGFAMLHPEAWSIEDQGEGQVVLVSEDEAARTYIYVYEYPDVEDDAEANQAALDDMMALLDSDDALENLEVTGSQEYWLGAYDAQMVDLAFTYDGTPYTIEVVASTPVPGTTYLIYFETPADQAEEYIADLDAMLYNFDILLSGIDRGDAGAAQPEFAEVWWEDDYSDNESGLYDDAEPQDWGQGYYDLESGQYIYALEAASGPIYDYYEDGAVAEPFMIQVDTISAGSVDNGYGFVFQLQDDDHFYTFRVSGDAYFTVEKANGDDFETLVDWTGLDNFGEEEEAVNTIAVAGGEGIYQLYVNGEQVGEFEDADFSEGTIGYIVENYDEADGSAVIFDNLVVGTPAE